MEQKSLAEQADEDFEIVNDSPNCTSDSIVDFVPMETSISNIDIPVQSAALKTFELIHKECAALKEEITMQQNLLQSKCSTMHTLKLNSKQKIEEMNDRMSLLVNDIQEKDERMHSLHSRMEAYKDASEKNDEMCAKMCEAEENLRYYKDLVERLRQSSDVFDEMAQPMSRDADLARELSEKDAKIRTLEQKLQEKDDALMALAEDHARLKLDNSNFENLIVALHAQIEQDQLDVQHLKSTYDRRVNDLNLMMLKRREDRSDNSEEQCPTLRENNNVSRLALNEPHGTPNRRFECDRCNLRLPTLEIYEKHVSRCATLLDSVF